MRYVKISGIEQEVSCVSLGTWVFGGTDWGAIDEKECIAAVHKAIECGVNLIDTAPIYGFGRAEEIVGKAIKGYRDKIIIATKCGLLKNGKGIKISLKPESIAQELDESLKRLGVDYIDLYQIHWPDPNTSIRETLSALLKLKKQGKIKYIGVSNFDVKLLKRAAQFCPLATLQNELSLLRRQSLTEILPYCEQTGTGFLAYGPLGGGILSGKYRAPAKFDKWDARTYFYKFYNNDNFENVRKLIVELERIAAVRGKPAAQVAINWTAQKKGVASVIVGGRNPVQAEINAGAGDWRLTEDEIKLLDSFHALNIPAF